MSGDEKGLFDHQYDRYFENRDQGEGYDFQQQTAGNVPPSTTTFAAKLRWWTWDRWRRRKRISQERDQRIQDIVNMPKPTNPPAKW